MECKHPVIEMLAEILEACEDGTVTTDTTLGAHTGYYRLRKYLGYLLVHGLIEQLTVENSHYTYHVTEIGSRVHKYIKSIRETE